MQSEYKGFSLNSGNLPLTSGKLHFLYIQKELSPAGGAVASHPEDLV